jgi:hypothetical protein
MERQWLLQSTVLPMLASKDKILRKSFAVKESLTVLAKATLLPIHQFELHPL